MLRFPPRVTGQQNRPATRTPTVCVVDPQAEDYDDWHSLAQASGLRLEVLASAEEGLRLARTASVDLWVINTRLPGISGSELCTMLKAWRPAVPVHLVCNEHSPAIERKAYASCATTFGVKPDGAALLRDWLPALR